MIRCIGLAFDRLCGLCEEKPWVTTAVLTVLIEAVTALFRFGLGMESTRDTAWLSDLTFGFRVHHGYLGAAMVISSMLAGKSALRAFLLVTGAAIAMSDLAHHFLVLWPITGSHQFDIRY